MPVSHAAFGWLDRPLEPVLDHINGVNSYNRPQNLRYLCPNCDSQLGTRGGKNKGKVRKCSGGFKLKRPDAEWVYTMPTTTGVYKIG